jgi:hypothetical protein
MPVPTWIEQQWIRITRILLGVCPPTRRGKGRLRGNQISILKPEPADVPPPLMFSFETERPAQSDAHRPNISASGLKLAFVVGNFQCLQARMRFVYLIFVWTTEDESDDDIDVILRFKKKSRCEAFLRNNNLNMYLTFSRLRVSPFPSKLEKFFPAIATLSS